MHMHDIRTRARTCVKANEMGVRAFLLVVFAWIVLCNCKRDRDDVTFV